MLIYINIENGIHMYVRGTQVKVPITEGLCCFIRVSKRKEFIILIFNQQQIFHVNSNSVLMSLSMINIWTGFSVRLESFLSGPSQDRYGTLATLIHSIHKAHSLHSLILCIINMIRAVMCWVRVYERVCTGLTSMAKADCKGSSYYKNGAIIINHQ